MQIRCQICEMRTMPRRFRITLTETVEITETITIQIENGDQEKQRPASNPILPEQPRLPVEVERPPQAGGKHPPSEFHKRKRRVGKP
mgnify:CR=1 FL=1